MAAAETVAGGVGALNLLSRHIRETKSLMETAVEEVCQSFEDTARLSQSNLERTTQFLGQHTEEPDGHRGVDLEGLIERSERVLHLLLERLSEASEKSRSAIQRLNQIDERIGRVAFTLDQINDITTANRILAVNARIQVAQLGQQGSGLGVVADEISQQAKRSSEFSSAIATLIGQLREAVTLSREDLLVTASHDREALDESKREVIRTHTDFRQFLDRTHVFLKETAEDSRKLTVDIHDSVRGLQFQDRASQRLQFIASEMDRIIGEMSAEFSVEAGAAMWHPSVREMMTRTSMMEQRGIAQAAGDGGNGEVELF